MNAKDKFLQGILDAAGVGYASEGLEKKAGLFTANEAVLLNKVINKNFSKEDVIKIKEALKDGGLAPSIKKVACEIALIVMKQVIIKSHSKALEAKLDSKLDEIADAWQEANLVAVTNKLKIQMFDNLNKSLGSLLDSQKIKVSYDLVADLKAERGDLEESIQEALVDKQHIVQACYVAEKASLINKMTKHLSDVKRAKVLPMLETITPSASTAKGIKTIIDYSANLIQIK